MRFPPLTPLYKYDYDAISSVYIILQAIYETSIISETVEIAVFFLPGRDTVRHEGNTARRKGVDKIARTIDLEQYVALPVDT